MSQFVRRTQTLKFIAVASMASIGIAASANAGTVPLLTMEWFASNDDIPGPVLWNMGQEGEYNHLGGGTYQFLGGSSSKVWDMSWDMTANANSGGIAAGSSGAFVTASLAITNTSASYQTFSAFITLNLDNPILGGTFMNGSSSASVSDAIGMNAELRAALGGDYAGDPIYSAYIDGIEQQTLMDNPFSLTASAFSSNSESETFGNPVPLVGPDAMNTIGVWIRFELSPGHTANVVGTFEVMPIPSPAGLPLLAGLGWLAGARRRRLE